MEFVLMGLKEEEGAWVRTVECLGERQKEK